MVNACANGACASGIGGRGGCIPARVRCGRIARECSFIDDWPYGHVVADKPHCCDLP
jgi:hypothetical protein